MATLSLRDFNDWVQQQAAAMQASAAASLNFQDGSPLLAIAESNAAVALWMQWLLLIVLRTTRASSSAGGDLDTWMADFSLTREPAVPATGTVTFSALTVPSSPVAIPVGTIVKTSDLTVSFQTSAAASLPAGSSSVNVPVQAIIAGTSGNVAAGTISIISGALPRIDFVTNSLAFVNGIDQETDSAFRARFVNYINSRASGTPVAAGYAISSVQQGLTWSITENYTKSGAYKPGNYVIYVDDGSGNPSSTLIANVSAACDAVRPVGATFQIYGPTVVAANVNLGVDEASGYTHAQAVAAAGVAVTNAINSCQMSAGFSFWTVPKVVLECPQVADVNSITINGQSGDNGTINGAAGSVVRAGTITVS